MNQADKQALDQISNAIQPGVVINRQGFAMLEQVIQHVGSRLTQLAQLEREKAQRDSEATAKQPEVIFSETRMIGDTLMQVTLDEKLNTIATPVKAS